MHRVVLAALLAAMLAAAYMLYTDRPLETGSGAYVSLYNHRSSGLVAAMAAGDGQSYGALAQDPTMARPGVFHDGPNEAAYRYQRPVLGYLAWIGSFGRPEWEPDAQAAWVILGAAAAAAACAEMLRRRNIGPYFALAVLFAPGMLASISGLTAEPIALAFLTAGLLTWWSPHRRTACAVCFLSLAALTRESSLVAVVPLGMLELLDAAGTPRRDRVRRVAPRRDRVRRVAPRRDRVRRVAPLVVPFAVYASWLVIVRVRVDAWPVAGRAVRLSAVPFAALAHEVPRFEEPASTWLWLIVGALLVTSVLWRARKDPLTSMVVAYATFAAFFGTDVWRRWQDFSRPLLPLYAYSVLALLTALAAPTSRSTRRR
jgi:hypothetical protein